jgi:hypothetical protein
MKRNEISWRHVREELRPKFIKAGITFCELRWHGCEGRAHLTFAHSLRRNDIDKYRKDGDLEQYALKMREVIRACRSCHSKLDANKRPVTYEMVRDIINKRSRPIE